MSANVGQGFRLLKLLWEYTNIEHSLSQREIRTLYNNIYGEDIGTKSLRSALRQLCQDRDSCVECGGSKTRVNGPRSTKKTPLEVLMTDIYVEHEFSEPELRFLIDLVTYCNAVSPRYRADMVEKLRRLGSRHFKNRSVLTMEKMHTPENWDMFLTVEILDEAMRQDRKVRLNYLRYNTAGELETRKGSNGADRVYLLSPHQFAVNAGRYYLICIDDVHDTLGHYRVDRMCNVEITDEKRRPLEDILPGTSDLSSQMQKYCDEHVDMLAGHPIWAVMRIDPEVVPVLADTYGQAVKFEEQDGELRARVHAAPLAIERTVKAHAPLIELLSPAELRDKVRMDIEEALHKFIETPGSVLAAAEQESIELASSDLEASEDAVGDAEDAADALSEDDTAAEQPAKEKQPGNNNGTNLR